MSKKKPTPPPPPPSPTVIQKIERTKGEIEAAHDLAKGLPNLIVDTVNSVPKVVGAVVSLPGKLLRGIASGIFGSNDEPETPTPQQNITPQPIAQIANRPQTTQTSQPVQQVQKGQVREIRLQDLMPNPAQPRKFFDEAALDELAKSIAREGVIQPILVRELRSGKFEIIAGERRFRAAKKAKLTKIPAIVKNVDDAAAFELSVIENIQRENLNPIEEAEAYKVLIEQYRCTQEAVAAKVGKSQSHIANMLRILTLPDSVLARVRSGELGFGHAKTLVGQENAEALAAEIIQHKLNLKEADALSPTRREQSIKNLSNPTPTPTTNYDALTEHLAVIEKRWNAFGLKVKVDRNRLTIWYPSIQALEEITARVVNKKIE